LGSHRIIAKISRTTFIKKIEEEEWSRRVKDFMGNIHISDQNQRKRQGQDEMILKKNISQVTEKKKSKRLSKKKIINNHLNPAIPIIFIH